MVAMVTGESPKITYLYFYDSQEVETKVRKFDGLSSSRPGDIEENCGKVHYALPILIRVKHSVNRFVEFSVFHWICHLLVSVEHSVEHSLGLVLTLKINFWISRAFSYFYFKDELFNISHVSDI